EGGDSEPEFQFTEGARERPAAPAADEAARRAHRPPPRKSAPGSVARAMAEQASPAAAAPPRSATYDRRYPADFFGKLGGTWEYVARAEGSLRWYVYVPVELTSGEVADPRLLPAIWTIQGERRPGLTLDKKEWLLHLLARGGNENDIVG